MSHIIVYLALLQIAHSAFRHSLIASPAFYIPRFTAPKTLLTETRATRNLDDDDVEETIDPLLIHWNLCLAEAIHNFNFNLLIKTKKTNLIGTGG